MFLGSYPINIDDKGRMRLPVRFRNKLDGEIFIWIGTRNSLFVGGEEEFERSVASHLEGIKLHEKDKQEAYHQILARVQVVEQVDDQGRFILNSALKNRVGIDKKTIIMGAGTRLEIYSAEEYERQYGDNSEFSMEVAVDRLKI